MKLGFVTAILPEQSLEDVLRTASEFGYDCVEVMCWPPGKAERRYAGVTHLDATDFDDAKAREVTALTEKYGVSISGLGYYPNPLSPDEQESQVGPFSADTLLDGPATELRHDHVEQGQVDFGGMVLENREGLPPVGRR